MVLFCVPHMGGLSQCITLRLEKHIDEQAVLFTRPEFMSTGYAERLIRNGIFDTIIPFVDEFKKTSPLKWEDYITEYFDKIFEDMNKSLSDFDTIYFSADTNNNFYIYCCLKCMENQVLIFFEMYEKHFQNQMPYTVNRNLFGGDIELEKLNRNNRALTGGLDEKISKRYLYSDKDNIINEKDEEYDFLGHLYGLSDENKEKIINSFDLPKKIDFSQSGILFCNSFAYSSPRFKLPADKFYLPYYLLADYYFSPREKVYIKDHPMSDHTKLNDYLESYKSRLLAADVPIELMGVLPNFRVKKALSCASSSIDKIARFVDSGYCVGNSYLSDFRLVHKLYFTFLLEEFLPESIRFHYFGIDKEMLNSFKQHTFGAFPERGLMGISTSILKGNIFTIIGDIPNEETHNIERALIDADLNTKVVFLGDIEKNSFITPEHMDLLDYIVPITINKVALRNNTVSDLDDEHFYFFCKNNEIREKVKRFHGARVLKYTGIEAHMRDYDEARGVELLNTLKAAIIENSKNLPPIPNNSVSADSDTEAAPPTCILWCGNIDADVKAKIGYTRYYNETKELNILGITSNVELYQEIFGFKFISKKEVVKELYDYVIILASDKEFNKIRGEVVSHGFSDMAIIPFKAMTYDGFSVQKYSRLKENIPTIFASNCWGGSTYHNLGLPFNSPTVNLFFGDSDYIKFLKDPRHYIDFPLSLESTGYNSVSKFDYPIIRCDDIILNFNHYNSFDCAKDSWERRSKRINWNNIFVMMFTQSPSIAAEFADLPYEKKVCFVPFPTNEKSLLYVEYLPKIPNIEFWQVNLLLARGDNLYYDVFDLLNDGKITKTISLQ